MKKAITLFTAITFSVVLFGQIKIIDNNNVGIHTDNPLSKVSVGSDGYSSYYFSIFAPENLSVNGLRVEIPTTLSSRTAIVGYTPGGTGWARGILGTAYRSTPTNSGRSYGVRGDAGNSTSGWNYAVYGNILGTNNGAGIYGTVNTADVKIDGIYAGYFNGNVKITGNAWINGSTIVTSDITHKKEIKNLEKGSTANLKKLNGIKYKLKDPNELAADRHPTLRRGTDTTTTIEKTPEMTELYAKERIGLSAQQLQQVYPELVVEGQDGTLGVDYIGLIPILIEAIKEQQDVLEGQAAEILELKQSIKKGRTRTN